MPLAEQHIANRSIVGIFPEGARPALWPNFDSLVGLDPRTPRGGMMLRLAPWLHPIAVRVEALIQPYIDNSDNLPGDLPRVITLSWDWRSGVAIPAHNVLC